MVGSTPTRFRQSPVENVSLHLQSLSERLHAQMKAVQDLDSASEKTVLDNAEEVFREEPWWSTPVWQYSAVGSDCGARWIQGILTEAQWQRNW